MDRIENLQQVLGWSNEIRSKKHGYLTNFYLDDFKHQLWIEQKSFYYVVSENVIFLLHLSEHVNHLYFIASSDEDLKIGLKGFISKFKERLVVDLVGDLRIESLKKIFQEYGFTSYRTLYRMSRIGNPILEDKKNVEICLATLDDANNIHKMLNEYFDPLSEQIPEMEEICYFQKNNEILICKEKEKIKGFIIFELKGLTLYLRYWFVLPEYRDQKIGSSLFNAFFQKGAATKRQMLWVIDENNNAIKRYEHYGFSAEKMYNFVLIK